jgi:DNA-binding NarL/FixJ family response regulator
VLVVNADRRVRRDLAELLALAQGVEVIAPAADPGVALAAIEAFEPDVVVVDPRLPHVDDGLAFVAAARRTSDAWIVILCHDAAQRERMLASGADAFLTEDDNAAAVIETVAMRALRGGRREP